MNPDGILEITCPLGKYWRALGVTEDVIVAETVTEAEARVARSYYLTGYEAGFAAAAAAAAAAAGRREPVEEVAVPVEEVAMPVEEVAVPVEEAATLPSPGPALEALPLPGPALAPSMPSAAALAAKKPRGTRSPKSTAGVLHPLRLAVQNGVLAFPASAEDQSLKLLPPDSAITLRAGRLGFLDPIPYIPWDSLREEETTGQLMNFLRALFPCPDMLNYMVWTVASCLTGAPGVSTLFLCQGPGSNGKSAFQTLVTLTLGDYATTMQGEMLCKKTSTDQFRKVVDHRRCIAVGEPVLGTPLNAASLATLLDAVTAHVFLFTCEHPLLKGTRPEDGGDALWSRIRVVPFESTFSTDEAPSTEPADLHLQTKLPQWRKAFLALLVDRLTRPPPDIPAKMREATSLYNAKNNPIQQFVRTCFAADETAPLLGPKAVRALWREWRLSNPTDVKEAEVQSRLLGPDGFLRGHRVLPLPLHRQTVPQNILTLVSTQFD